MTVKESNHILPDNKRAPKPVRCKCRVNKFWSGPFTFGDFQRELLLIIVYSQLRSVRVH